MSRALTFSFLVCLTFFSGSAQSKTSEHVNYILLFVDPNQKTDCVNIVTDTRAIRDHEQQQ